MSVSAGYAAWIDYEEDNIIQDRVALAMKLELNTSVDYAQELFRYVYQGGDLDDDAYVVIPYGDDFTNDQYVLMGYYQCDIDGGNPSDASRLLAVGFEDNEGITTEVFTLLTGEDDNGDSCYRDAVYTDKDRYIACGWFFPDHTEPAASGFFQVCRADESMYFYEDPIVSHWEKLLISSTSEYQVLGGAGSTTVDAGKTDLFLGVFSGGIMYRNSHAEVGYSVLEGPLVEIAPNTFLYMGNAWSTSGVVTIEAYIPTLWSWTGDAIIKLDQCLITNNNGHALNGYTHIGLIHAEVIPSGVLGFANARNSVGEQGILITKTAVNTNLNPCRIGGTSFVDFVSPGFSLGEGAILDMRSLGACPGIGIVQ